MKKLLTISLLAALVTISFTSLSHAQNTEGTGIGFMVGEPTGLSLKTWTGGNNAIDAGLAW